MLEIKDSTTKRVPKSPLLQAGTIFRFSHTGNHWDYRIVVNHSDKFLVMNISNGSLIYEQFESLKQLTEFYTALYPLIEIVTSIEVLQAEKL